MLCVLMPCKAHLCAHLRGPVYRMLCTLAAVPRGTGCSRGYLSGLAHASCCCCCSMVGLQHTPSALLRALDCAGNPPTARAGPSCCCVFLCWLLELTAKDKEDVEWQENAISKFQRGRQYRHT